MGWIYFLLATIVLIDGLAFFFLCACKLGKDFDEGGEQCEKDISEFQSDQR